MSVILSSKDINLSLVEYYFPKTLFNYSYEFNPKPYSIIVSTSILDRIKDAHTMYLVDINNSNIANHHRFKQVFTLPPIDTFKLEKKKYLLSIMKNNPYVQNIQLMLRNKVLVRETFVDSFQSSKFYLCNDLNDRNIYLAIINGVIPVYYSPFYKTTDVTIPVITTINEAVFENICCKIEDLQLWLNNKREETKEQIMRTFGSVWNTNKIRTFCINLERRPDRKEAMESQLLKENIPFEIFPAVDGKQILDDDKRLEMFDKNVSRGAIGCSLSHIELWIKLLNEPEIDTYLIMEDDLVLGNNFNDKLDTLLRSMNDKYLPSLIFLHYHMMKNIQEKLHNFYNHMSDKYSVIETLKSNNCMGGTGLYLVNKKFVKEFLPYIQFMSMPIDNLIFNSHLVLGNSRPFLCFTDWVSDFVTGKKSLVDSDIQYDNLVDSRQKNIFMFWEGSDYSLISLLRKIIFSYQNKYKIHFINYKNLHLYVPTLPPRFYNYHIAHQADYVRVVVLQKFGGIWLDSDTILLDNIDSLFSLLETNDGFFIRENKVNISNGIFGTKPNTELMNLWLNKINDILKSPKTLIWTEIGTRILSNIPETFYRNYKIFNGLDNMYPVSWDKSVDEFCLKPYENYKTIVREYQPLLVLVNSVYKHLHKYTEEEILELDIPLSYFLKIAINNSKKNI